MESTGSRDGSGFGCAKCWPEAAAAAWEAGASLVNDAALVDDSHLDVMIRSCPACGQRFVSIFIEFIEFFGGDDDMHSLRMPITADEAASLIGLDGPSVVSAINGLDPQRRSLQRSPSAGPDRVEWKTGILIQH